MASTKKVATDPETGAKIYINDEPSIDKKLQLIQCALHAPKDSVNTFGKYNYRTCEQIIEAVKPYLAEFELNLTLHDAIVEVGGRFYIMATAKLTDVKTFDIIQTTAYAREQETKSGMDAAQITGACSSYARKYALNGLFAIDDTKDVDTDEHAKEAQERAKKDAAKKQAAPVVKNEAKQEPTAAVITCQFCNQPLKPTEKYTVERIASESKKLHKGKVFCMDCLKKIAIQNKANEAAKKKAAEQGGEVNVE